MKRNKYRKEFMARIVQQNGATAAHTHGRLIIGTDIVCGEAGAPARTETPICAAIDGAGVACVIDFGANPATRAANARRIVAAWAICGAAPTEAIEELDELGGITAMARFHAARDKELNRLRASLAAAELLLIERDATIAHLRQRDSERVDIPLFIAGELPGHGDASTGSSHD